MLVLQLLRRCIQERKVMRKALRLLILIEYIARDSAARAKETEEKPRITREEQSKVTKACWDLINTIRDEAASERA